MPFPRTIPILFCMTSIGTAQENPQQFVQDFYNWYSKLANTTNNSPAFEIAIAKKPNIFAPGLLQALQADAQAQAKAEGEIVGIDWDPFLSGQDPKPRYEVGQIEQKGDRFLVPIFGVRSGKRSKNPSVVAEVAKTDGQWQFLNFHYPPSRDLLTSLKLLAKSRQELPKGSAT